MTLERILRAVAIVIAGLGIVDPTIAANREVTATVAVIETTAGAAETLTLPPRLRMSRGPSPDAAATIVVGHRLPAFAESIAAPAFFVRPIVSTASPLIRQITAPSRARFESRVTVVAAIETRGVIGQTLTVRLDGAGTLLDRVARTVEGDGILEIPLGFVPATTGLTRLRVTATLAAARPAVADLAVDVDDRPWAVLFFDRRPSWNATFVRRALEQDRRFSVSSRVVASTGVAATSGRPPDSLTALDDTRRFDAIVVGAPDALTARDVSGLEAFARRRGGAIVMLLDDAKTGPAESLIGVDRWSAPVSGDVDIVPNQAAGSAPLHASEIITPTRLPDGAEALAWLEGKSTGPAPVFQTPIGAGRIVVSGVLDGWRYRGVPETSAFGAFFRWAIGRAAEASPASVDVNLGLRVIAPGQPAEVFVTVREAVLADPARPPTSTAVSSIVTGPQGASFPLRLWPEASPGRFRGTLRGPEAPGTYSISVTAGTEIGSARLAVVADATEPANSATELLATWASSRGGQLVTNATPEALDTILSAAIPAVRRPTQLHPLRSVWWIGGFAAALGAEWWLRRRREMK